jgi:hypothetical protein
VSGTASVWWTWTPSISGRYGINTNGSNFDTTLGVYTGSAVNALTLVAQNDDGSQGLGTPSQVSFNAVGGTAYRIQVNGYDPGTGAAIGNISISIAGPVTATVAWVTPPPANVPPGSTLTVSWSTSATSSLTDLLIDTINPPDLTTGISAQSGPAGTYSEPLQAPNIGGTWWFQAHAIIGGVDFYSTVIQVTVSSPPAPVNDTFSGPLVTVPSTVLSGTNVGATAETGEPDPAANSGTASVWWSWTCPATGTATITTAGSDFDTTLGVYTGSDVAALTLVAQNDDVTPPTDLTSAVTFSAFAGVTYRIQVNGADTGLGADTGNISLNISLSVPPPPAKNGGGGGGGHGGRCGLLGLDAILILGVLRRVARKARGR